MSREPQELLLRAAQKAMREAGLVLRQRGWPVELIVDRVPERDSFAVSLRFELPPIPVPQGADGGYACDMCGEAGSGHKPGCEWGGSGA